MQAENQQLPAEQTGIEPRDPKYKNSVFTIPNIICFGRIVGSFVLLATAVAGWQIGFVLLFVALSLSDWIDGKLARRLHQRSDLGARIDSLADSILYAALIGGALILNPDMITQEAAWIIAAIVSYALTTAAGLLKYGKVPSYHTYGAKACQWLALVAGVYVVMDWSPWPLRVTTIVGVLTNLEATAITLMLNQWRADVPSLLHVWKSRSHDAAKES